MFPPTVLSNVIQKKKSLRCINVQCNEEFLGSKAGENELTAIPDKTIKQDPNPTVYIRLCVPFILPIHTPHRNYVQDTQKCMGLI